MSQSGKPSKGGQTTHTPAAPGPNLSLRQIKTLVEREGLAIVADVDGGIPAWWRSDEQTVPVIVTSVLDNTAVNHPARDITTTRLARLDDLFADPAQVPITRPYVDPRRAAAATGRANALFNKKGTPGTANAPDRSAEPDAPERLAAATTHSGKPMEPNLLRRIDEQRRELVEARPLAELAERVIQLVTTGGLEPAEVLADIRLLVAPFAVRHGATTATAGAA